MYLSTAPVIGRRTSIAWWCRNGHRNDGPDRICHVCAHDRIERHAQVHPSERAVVFRHPVTGEIRNPGRADAPMPAEYAAQGYERHEIMNMTAYEKSTGQVHEASNFTPGNEPSPERHPTATAPKEVKEGLLKIIADAHQSGDWTMDTPLVPES